MFDNNNFSYYRLRIAVSKMWMVPALQRLSKEGNDFLLSLKWPLAAPPLSLGHQNLPSKQSLKHLLIALVWALTSQQHPAKREQQQLRRDSSLQGDAGLQKTASCLKFNLNPPPFLWTLQNLQLFPQLYTQ